MMNTAIASLALLAATAAADYGYTATTVGSAHVVNNCNYPVQLCNVPASGGGYEQEDKTLASGESWSQPWTQLTNGAGWSIKLSKTDSFQSNILQYEYQFANEGIIWFDLSCVNGNPWDHDWELTANGTDCQPKQQAYRYATDDAYGMQSCSQATAITVTLCTGVSADNGSAVGGSSSEDSSASAPSSASSVASAPSYEDQASTSEAASAPAATAYGYNWNNADAAKSSAAMSSPTTFATAVTAASEPDSYGVTVTEIETIYHTAAVTAYGRHRRHEHNHGGHRHE